MSPTHQCRERQAVYIELFAKLSFVQGMVVGLELPENDSVRGGIRILAETGIRV